MSIPYYFDFIWGYSLGTLPADVDSTVVDYRTATTAFLPAGCCVHRVWMGLTPDSVPLPSGITMTMGIVGNNQLMIPTSAGLTTDMINAGPIMIPVLGLQVAPLENAT